MSFYKQLLVKHGILSQTCDLNNFNIKHAVRFLNYTTYKVAQLSVKLILPCLEHTFRPSIDFSVLKQSMLQIINSLVRLH